jgi:hypothetical protein
MPCNSKCLHRVFLLLFFLLVVFGCGEPLFGSDSLRISDTIVVSSASYSAAKRDGEAKVDNSWTNQDRGGDHSAADQSWEKQWVSDDNDRDDAQDAWSEEDKKGDDTEGDQAWEEQWASDDNDVDDAEDVWSEEGTEIVGDEDKGRFTFSGEVLNKLAHDVREDNSFESILFNHVKLRAGATMVQSERLYAVLFGVADYFSYVNDEEYDDDTTIRLEDAYFNLRENRFNFRLGNQVVRWGKTDAYSPLDNVNPEDLRDDLSGRREDRKLSIPIVNLELYTESITISGLFIPWFVRSKYDLTGTDWALFGYVEGLTFLEEDPPNSLDNSEGGIRVSGVMSKIDWALSWLHAREDLPTPDTLVVPSGVVLPVGDLAISELADLTDATGQQVFLTHDRQNIYGFEFETTLSSFGVRGDLAYRDDVSFYTRDLERIRKPVIEAMAGVDYFGPSDWYANIQLFLRQVQDYDNRIIWDKETSWAVNGTLWKEYANGNLRFECGFYYDLAGEATVFNPMVLLSYWKPLVIEIGGEWFDGSTETQIGRWTDNDQIYTILKIEF